VLAGLAEQGSSGQQQQQPARLGAPHPGVATEKHTGFRNKYSSTTHVALSTHWDFNEWFTT